MIAGGHEAQAERATFRPETVAAFGERVLSGAFDANQPGRWLTLCQSQCNPPERGPVQHKERSVTEQFIRHLLCDILTRKTIDKVLKLLRKLRWDDPEVYRVLFKMFSRPWKVAYGSVTLLTMLTYDLQRYHPDFAVAVVDQMLENIRRGMELNIYRDNQKRVATVKYLGELYIYRMINSRVVFDTLWSLVTFGHRGFYNLLLRIVTDLSTLHNVDR
jgi:MIF4G domain